MTAAHARTLCCQDCSTDAALAVHHDRLLTVDTDAEELLALLEMAVTWYELDYSDSPVVGPASWMTFAPLAAGISIRAKSSLISAASADTRAALTA